MDLMILEVFSTLHDSMVPSSTHTNVHGNFMWFYSSYNIYTPHTATTGRESLSTAPERRAGDMYTHIHVLPAWNRVDGVGGKESTPASSGKAASCRPGFQELEEKMLEASVLGPFHLHPGRHRGAGWW